TNFANVLAAASRSMTMLSSQETHDSVRANTKGAHDHRMDDWKSQAQVAKDTKLEIDEQILSAQIRKEIAQKELANHETQTQNAVDVDTYLRRRFTNKALYEWTIGQVAATYFQAYQLAFDTARKAERAFRFELGLSDSSFIGFGYWDSLKRGLLAAD